MGSSELIHNTLFFLLHIVAIWTEDPVSDHRASGMGRSEISHLEKWRLVGLRKQSWCVSTVEILRFLSSNSSELGRRRAGAKLGNPNWSRQSFFFIYVFSFCLRYGTFGVICASMQLVVKQENWVKPRYRTTHAVLQMGRWFCIPCCLSETVP